MKKACNWCVRSSNKGSKKLKGTVLKNTSSYTYTQYRVLLVVYCDRKTNTLNTVVTWIHANEIHNNWDHVQEIIRQNRKKGKKLSRISDKKWAMVTWSMIWERMHSSYCGCKIYINYIPPLLPSQWALMFRLCLGHLDRVLHGISAEEVLYACDETTASTTNTGESGLANPAVHFFRGLRHRNMSAIRHATQVSYTPCPWHCWLETLLLIARVTNHIL